jgi:beta-lactamase regulating signal transducer with metallopeptidase domain
MTAWLIETLVATTMLLAVVLIIRKPVARRFGPRVAYALWLLPALRMILPPLPRNMVAAPLDGVVSPTAVASAVSPLLAIAVLWMAGAAAFLVWHMIAYRRFTQKIAARSTPLFNENRISVQSSRDVASPLAFGVFGKTVILPDDFDTRYHGLEQRFALAHEMTHHRRGDLAANLLAMAMLALHWWNPLAHFAWRAFRLDQEAACDAMVLAGASQDERHAYGSALVKAAAGRVPLAACTISAAETIKARLRLIIDQPDAGQARIGALMAGVTVFSGLALTASGEMAAQTVSAARPHAPVMAFAKPASAPVVPVLANPPLSAPKPQILAAVTAPKPVIASPASAEIVVEAKAAVPMSAAEPAAVAQADPAHVAEAQLAQVEAAQPAMDQDDAPVQLRMVQSVVLTRSDGVVEQHVTLVASGNLRQMLTLRLQDARRQIAASQTIAEEERARVLQAIDAKLAEVRAADIITL